MRISQAAVDLIVREEVGSRRLYEAKYTHPEWPGGQSGVTIGIGYDCGYSTPARLRADWSGKIPDGMIRILEAACGLTREAAHARTRAIGSTVTVPWDAAMAVFESRDAPRWEAIVTHALPNTDKLSSDSYGAIVSLAYNRGASFSNAGDRYREMRAIKDHMTTEHFSEIPQEFRSMMRLWPSTSGVHGRREREAVLFEAGLHKPAMGASPPTLVPVVPGATIDRTDDAGISPVVPSPSSDIMARGVLWIQHALNTLGADPKLIEDGKSGKATMGMLSAFQRENGLTDTGLADAATIAELEKHLAGGAVVAAPAPDQGTAPQQPTVQASVPPSHTLGDEVRSFLHSIFG